MEDQARKQEQVISDFLQFLYKNTSSYILKGGTALRQCYNLDRFSEDIYLDGNENLIFDLIDRYCKGNSYDYREDKNTDTLKRCMIRYGGAKPLKIEVSCRKNVIEPKEYVKINGIIVYTIERLASMKCSAYASRDKMRDMYDLSFICCNYYDRLSEQTKNFIFDTISAKGIEQYYYLVYNHPDKLINKKKLLDLFLSAIEKIGLQTDGNENELIKEYIKEYDETTGLPIDKGYLECGLPPFLRQSIEQMKAAWEKHEKGIPYMQFDCDFCELQSNINIAETEQLITTEQAWYLREKYLGLERN